MFWPNRFRPNRGPTGTWGRWMPTGYRGGYRPPAPGYGRGTGATPLGNEEWFPELYALMYGKLQGGQRDLMNQITGNLGRTLGRHLSRTNVAVPVGADALARRYMSPLSQAMEMANPLRNVQGAMSMAKMFAPGFKAWWAEKDGTRDPLRYLNKYMNRYWGGGR